MLALLWLAAWPAPRPAPQTPPAAVDYGTAPVSWDELRTQLEQQADFYRWASQQPPPTTRPRTTPPRADFSGDRFDRLANCESGMRQDAVGGGGRYLSFFQWSMTTWHSAGGTGDPRNVDYGTQKQIAMQWAQIANPAGQWPVCWPRSAS